MVVNGEKRCPKCSTLKPIDSFYKSKYNSDGCSSYCKKCQNLRTTSYARENKSLIPSIGYALKRRYGISSEEYQTILEGQDNVCAICGQVCKSGRNLAVDHCHATGKIRGLLCTNCNTALGHFHDDILILSKAIKYLEESQ